MTKLVFMGTPAFSVPILEGLLAEGYEVVAVVTQPDRPVGRKKIITPSPVKEAAVKHGLPVLQPEKISGSAEMEEIIALRPDAIITAAFTNSYQKNYYKHLYLALSMSMHHYCLNIEVEHLYITRL